MKTSILALGALLGLASAQNAVVHNHCEATIYVQSFPYDGSAPGPLTTVKSGETFSEKFRPSGSVCYLILFGLATLYRAKKLTGDGIQTIKMGRAKTLGAPLFFGYSLTSSPDYAYCECTDISIS